MNNKRLGNEFEKEMAERLRKKGWWVTFMTPKQHIGSQPCDLIAIKDDKPVLIDCKTCKTKWFRISRIEENQWQAYKKFKQCGNGNYVLAVKYNEIVFIIPLDTIDRTQESIDLENQSYSFQIKKECGRTNENYSFK